MVVPSLSQGQAEWLRCLLFVVKFHFPKDVNTYYCYILILSHILNSKEK